MRFLRCAVLLASMACLALKAEAGASGGNNLILPGKSVGNVRVQDADGHLRALLGPPTNEDAAMGRLIQTWQAADGKTRLDVLLRRPETGNVFYVLDVRTNSSWFHTRNGVHVGSGLGAIKALFPDIEPVDTGTLPLARSSTPGESATEPGPQVYDSVARGIAFETDATGRCTGIVVHSPGLAVRIFPKQDP